KLKDNVTLMGGNDTTLILGANVKIFDVNDTKNIRVTNLTVDGSRQNGLAHDNNQFIFGENIDGLTIDNIHLKNGSMGVTVKNVKNYTLQHNTAEGFTGWPFSAGGNLENVFWENNRSNNGQ